MVRISKPIPKTLGRTPSVVQAIKNRNVGNKISASINAAVVDQNTLTKTKDKKNVIDKLENWNGIGNEEDWFIKDQDVPKSLFASKKNSGENNQRRVGEASSPPILPEINQPSPNVEENNSKFLNFPFSSTYPINEKYIENKLYPDSEIGSENKEADFEPQVSPLKQRENGDFSLKIEDDLIEVPKKYEIENNTYEPDVNGKPQDVGGEEDVVPAKKARRDDDIQSDTVKKNVERDDDEEGGDDDDDDEDAEDGNEEEEEYDSAEDDDDDAGSSDSEAYGEDEDEEDDEDDNGEENDDGNDNDPEDEDDDE